MFATGWTKCFLLPAAEPLLSEQIGSFDIHAASIDLRTARRVAEVSVNRPGRVPFESPDLKAVLVASAVAVPTERTPFCPSWVVVPLRGRGGPSAERRYLLQPTWLLCQYT